MCTSPVAKRCAQLGRPKSSQTSSHRHALTSRRPLRKLDRLYRSHATAVTLVPQRGLRGEFEIRYGIGIDRTASLLDAALEHGVIDKSGAWMSFDGERIGQGRANVLEFLNEHEDIKASIELDYKTAVAEARESGDD